MTRKVLKSITLEFEDGTTHRLEGHVLHAPKSGVLFWGDHAVENILGPFYDAHPELPPDSEMVMGLWNTPNEAGELPPFLIKPLCQVTTPDQLG